MAHCKFIFAAKCIFTPVMDEDDDLDEEDFVGMLDDETMNLMKFNVSFPLMNVILHKSSYSDALRLNTLTLLSSSIKGNFIKVLEFCIIPMILRFGGNVE